RGRRLRSRHGRARRRARGRNASRAGGFPCRGALVSVRGRAGDARRPRRRDRRCVERARFTQGARAMKRVLLVNGVPASGKSTVAKAVSEAEGWPLLTLDTIKEAFFGHLGTGDRDYNRTLGKASYQAIFNLIA